MTQRIIPFKPEHLEIMDSRSHEFEILSKNQKYIYNMAEASIACTAIVDGRIVCCFGIIPFLGDIGDVWLIPSVYMQEHAVRVAKGAKKWLMEIKEDLGLRRIQTDSPDDDFHMRWHVFLGFSSEGVRKNYINGMDYRIWGMSWE